MTGHPIHLCDAFLAALPSGALFWPEQALLCVSDLHLGKSERLARRGGALLPPYDSRATLAKLDADLARTAATTVVCLGDSFDDPAAADGLDDDDHLWLTRLMAGRRWLWVEGNHDPGPLDLGGSHLADLRLGRLAFRHIAIRGEQGEVSGHFHPKARVAGLSRPCFLADAQRIILPAYGSYTGGLDARDPIFAPLFGADAIAVMTGAHQHILPRAALPERRAGAIRSGRAH